jgi:glycosyltransferase involved in cell wall biosynthesis
MGPYRQGFLDQIVAAGGDLRFLVGDQHFLPSLRTNVRSPLVISTGRNVFLLGRVVGWQRGVLGRGLRARRLVVESNPRIITSWVLLVLRRVLGRPTYAWGHASGRRGDASKFRHVRRFMQWLSTGLIAYTSTEERVLRQRFRRKPVLVAHNALYAQAFMRPARQCLDGKDVVVVGRLVPDKKPGLAIEAFCLAADRLPADSRLHVVGDGPLASEVHDLVAGRSMEGRIVLHGEVTDPAALKGIFASCCFMLASGYVGLNVTQSLGFGVPVLYPEGEPHAPEVEALHNGNSVGYRAGDAHDCADAIVKMFVDRERWWAAGQAIASEARSKYSVERMARPFLQIAEQ